MLSSTCVDEVHHLLAGNYREQRASLNLLKYLANDLKISIVVVGTADAPLALATDAQMLSRVTPFEIPRWRESEDPRRLLGAFERLLPLRRPSELTRACGHLGRDLDVLDSDAMHEAKRDMLAKIRNETARRGGNAYVLTLLVVERGFSLPLAQGDAYACP